jgi:hypothetical protein
MTCLIKLYAAPKRKREHDESIRILKNSVAVFSQHLKENCDMLGATGGKKTYV